MNIKKQSGFTLVEIAIVLVVIGLLLGGILKGQQLINSARVRNLADQNSGVQAAYYGFVDRFRNLPGDMIPTNACTNVGSAVDPGAGGACATPANAPGGNGNGRIDSIVEAGAVWSHLSAAGFLNGTFGGFSQVDTPVAATYVSGVVTGNIPPNAFQGPIMLAHTNDYLEGASVRGSVSRLLYSFGGNVPVPLLRDLDQKLDDGVANTGVLRSAPSAAMVTPVGSVMSDISDYVVGTDDCLATNTWNVDSSNQTCNAIFLY
ncbi:MAG: prepilin-type N-terminal cleavage/methylation domain-containing protein [Gammaproteobacteria bacterium]|jgi:prepilin-type N-terminal cleavage/methylation domain-containing protein